MRFSRTTTFTLLMLFTALTATLPLTWTAWTGRVLQPLAWAQSVARLLVRDSVELVESGVFDGQTVPLRQYQELERQVEELRRQVGQQQLSLNALSDQFEAVTRLQGQLKDKAARIVVARITGGDTNPQRETVMISAGSLRGLEIGDWVVSSSSIHGEESITNRERLWRQWAIGQVSEVFPHASRVKLATDRGFGPIEVRMARESESGWDLAETPCALHGLGRGRMAIEQAGENYADGGYRHAMAVLPAGVPLVLTLGEVERSRLSAKSPLHYDLMVLPPGRLRRSDTVWVLKFEQPTTRP